MALFFQTYSYGFSSVQLNTWKRFTEELERYLPKIQQSLGDREVFEDPDWQRVREAATCFVAAFEQKPGDPGRAFQT
jgi:hypothetical protein